MSRPNRAFTVQRKLLRMAKKQDNSNNEITPNWRFIRYCLVLLLAGIMALLWLSMLTYNRLDPPSPHVLPQQTPSNAAGIVGSHVAYVLRYWMGMGTYTAMSLCSLAAVIMMLGGRISDIPWRIIGMTLLVVCTSAVVYLISPANADDVAAGSVGILGLAVGRFVLESFSRSGAFVVISFATCVGLMLTADNLVLKLPAAARWVAAAVKSAHILIANLVARIKAFRLSRAQAKRAAPKPAPRAKAAKTPSAEPAPAKPKAEVKPAPAPVAQAPAPAAPAPKPAPVAPVTQLALPIASPIKAEKPAKPAKAAGDYEAPSVDLLAAPTGGYSQIQQQEAARNHALLQQTLTNFNVAAEVVGYQTGPVITLFELSLAPGVKVAAVQNLATDIARALAVPGVRIVPPRFGKDTIGVEVPNLDKETVRIRELMNMAATAQKEKFLPLYLGKDAGGGAIVADLAGMPHMLIAGTTGSGKSVCINTIIMSLLLTRSPDEVRLILVDPKMVEMAAFENIPHLLCPIVNDMRRAEEILEWAAVKMDERYELLKEANVKNIAGFNRLGKDEIYKRFQVESEEEKARIPTRLPYYVIIIDELADLIMTADKEVEAHIIRIAQKARAVGIHLILATQRPSVNVVTGLIKSNMPCRVSFRVASRQESRIVLDQNGAEVLLGQGDMLFLQPGTSSLMRAQGTFVDDGEIKAVVSELRKIEPQYSPELMKLGTITATDGAAEKDELFDQGVEIVLASQRGSVSLLQRRLAIGYSRASRIIDQMALAGLLGDYKGSQARECLITLEDWQSMKGKMAADISGESSANGEGMSV